MPRRLATAREIARVGSKKKPRTGQPSQRVDPNAPPPIPGRPFNIRKVRPSHNPQGRPPDFLFDKGLVQRLCTGIENGLHPEEAASLAGISYRTFDRYRQYARLGHPDYQEVEDAIRIAEAKCTAKWVTRIEQAGIQGLGDKDPDWKALEKLLTLRMKLWKPKVDVSSSVEQEFEARRLLDIVRQTCPPELAEEIFRRYVAASGQGIPGGATGTEGRTGETAESSSGRTG